MNERGSRAFPNSLSLLCFLWAMIGARAARGLRAIPSSTHTKTGAPHARSLTSYHKLTLWVQQFTVPDLETQYLVPNLRSMCTKSCLGVPKVAYGSRRQRTVYSLRD